jgi:hypothetical protein
MDEKRLIEVEDRLFVMTSWVQAFGSEKLRSLLKEREALRTKLQKSWSVLKKDWVQGTRLSGEKILDNGLIQEGLTVFCPRTFKFDFELKD